MIRRVPRNAKAKGVLFSGLIERTRRVAPHFDPSRGVSNAPLRYLPFLDYPYCDLLRVIAAAGRASAPSEPLSRAIRRLGQPVFPEVRATRAGRLVMDVFAGSLEALLLDAPRSYSLFVDVGSYSSERVGPGHVRVRFDDYPGFLESYDVGVFEGALAAFHARGEVTATRTSDKSGYLDVRYAAP